MSKQEEVLDITRPKAERFSVSIPAPQNDALDSIVKETGLSKNDLIKYAVSILTTSMEAKKKGLDLAFSRDHQLVGTLVLPI